MDPTRLKQIVRDHIRGTTLDLPGDAFDDGPVRTVIDAFLDDDRLIITGITDVIESGSGIEVIGTGGNHPLIGMAVDASFTIVDEQPVLDLAATAVGWSPTTAWPILQTTAIASLAFTGTSTLRLRSRDESDGLGRGLTLSCTLALTGYLAGLAWLLGADTELSLSGPVGMQQNIPEMRLGSTLGGGGSVGFLTLGPVGFSLSTVAAEGEDGTRSRVVASITLASSIVFTANGTSVELPVAGEFFLRSSLIRLYVDVNQAVGAAIDASLDQLRSLMDGENLAGLIPDGLHLEEYVKLTQVAMLIDTATASLVWVDLGVETSRSWTVVSDDSYGRVISIEQIGLIFRLHLGADRRLEAMLFGDIGVGTGVISLSAGYPGFNVAGELKEGTSIDLTQIVEYFVGSSADVPAILVEDLEFAVDPATRAFSASLWLTSDYEIPLGGTSLVLREMRFAIDRPSGGGADAMISGMVTIADATIEAVWQLPGGFQFSGVLPEVSLSGLVDSLSDEPFFPEFPSITLRDSFIDIEKRDDGSFYLAVGTSVQSFGAFEVELLRVAGRTGFAAGFVLPGTWSLADLSSDFDPVGFIRLKDAAMTVASMDDPDFSFRAYSQPAFTFPARLPSAPPGVRRGIGLYGEILLEGGPLDVVAQLLSGVGGLKLGVIIPPRFAETELRATLGEPFHLIGDAIIINELALMVRLSPLAFFLQTSVTINLFDASVTLIGTIGVAAGQVILEMRTGTPWNEPFGIQGLSIDKLGIRIALGAGLTVSFGGQITIGSGDSRLVLEAGGEFRPPSLVPQALLAREVGTIRLGQIIDTFTQSAIPAELVDVELSDFELIVVANPLGWSNPADGKFYSAGLAVGGVLTFFGLTARFAIQVYYTSGIFAKGQLDGPLEIGGVVRLTSASSRDQGAYVEINTANAPYLRMSMALTLFEITEYVIEATVDRSSFYVHFKYPVAVIGETEIEGYLRNRSEFAMSAAARFGLRGVSIRAGDLDLGTLRVDLLVEARFGVEIGPGVRMLIRLGATFEIAGVGMSLNDVTLELSISRLEQIAEVYLEEIKNRLWDIGATLFRNVEAFFQAVGKGFIQLNDSIGTALNRVYGQSIEQGARYLRGVADVMAYNTTKVAGLLESGYSAGSTAVAGALRSAGYTAEEVGRAIADVFQMGAEEVAQVLRQVGYQIEEIGRTLRNVFGYGAEKTADFFKDAWNLGGDAVNEALKGAGYAADQVAGAMESVYDWGKDVIEDIGDALDPSGW